MSDTYEGETLRFLVRGSQGDEYTVAFTFQQGEATSDCTCMGGRMGRFCKHRTALLDGDVSDLLSDNGYDVTRLRQLLDGTELDRVIKEASLLRKKVKVLADIAGTGIKAGMIGEVIESQTVSRRGTSFTQLAATAHLVRFTKRSLKLWEEALTAPSGYVPVGAELWLRGTEIEPVSEG
ncbi:hypothetical protein ACW7BC_18300 [Azospirillum argentinense]